ncbi:MAG: sigma-70 family RNA polymerase sigma factor [Verrucomicrobiota bacterium]
MHDPHLFPQGASGFADWTDQALIDAVNEGNHAAFEALYRRSRDWVVRLAYRFTRDAEASEDALQETFLYLLGKFPGFELRCQLKTFLYPVVRSFSLNLKHKREREADSKESLLVLSAEYAPQPAVFPLEEFEYALSKLSVEQREVLILRFVDQLSLREVAQAMDLPLGTVKSRLHFAVGLLRQDERLQALFAET